IAVHILENQRKFSFSDIAPVLSFSNRASRWMRHKGAVVGLAIVVAREAKAGWASQDQNRRRERPPELLGIDQRRIERREIRAPLVVFSLKGPDGRVNNENGKYDERGDDLNPPRVVSLRTAEAV